MINQWMRVLVPQTSGNPTRQMRRIDKNRHGMASSSLTMPRLFCFVFPNFLCYISSQYPKRHLAGKWQKVLARVKNSLNFDRKFPKKNPNFGYFFP
jgi:hypothetical protein